MWFHTEYYSAPHGIVCKQRKTCAWSRLLPKTWASRLRMTFRQLLSRFKGWWRCPHHIYGTTLRKEIYGKWVVNIALKQPRKSNALSIGKIPTGKMTSSKSGRLSPCGPTTRPRWMMYSCTSIWEVRRGHTRRPQSGTSWFRERLWEFHGRPPRERTPRTKFLSGR